MAENTIGSCSHIKQHRINTSRNTLQQIIASIVSEKIYYHNLTLIVRKILTSTSAGIGSNTKTTTHKIIKRIILV